jgi:FkbM family methyltransferase
MLDKLDYIYETSGRRTRRVIAIGSRLCRFATFLNRMLRIGGYTMVLDPTDPAYFRYRRHRGDYESAAAAVTLGFLKRNPGSIFVDIGASYGFYTLSAAELANRDGGIKRIYAFEPDPRPVRALRRATGLNGFGHITEVHQFAVGDFSGKTHLFRHRRASTGNRAFALGDDQEKYCDPESVDAISLDAFLLERHGSGERFVIKIDVEGAEVRVLRGAIHTLSQAAGYAIVVEYHPADVRECGFTAEDFAKAIEALKPDIVFCAPSTGSARELRELINDIDSEVSDTNSHSRKLFFARGMQI